jgi:RNA polymerase sigma factor (sigma-70 family)
MRAAEMFDASLGNKFSTYAFNWIRQSISRGAADESRLIRLPIHLVEQIATVVRARDRLWETRGTATMSQIAAEAGVSDEDARKLLRLNVGIVSLDKPISSEGGDSLGDFVIEDSDYVVDPAQLVDDAILAKLVVDSLSELPERQALIMRRRAGIGYDAPATLHEIGRDLNITRERVRQLEKQAIPELAVALERRGLRSLSAKLATEEPGKKRKRIRRS